MDALKYFVVSHLCFIRLWNETTTISFFPITFFMALLRDRRNLHLLLPIHLGSCVKSILHTCHQNERYFETKKNRTEIALRVGSVSCKLHIRE